MRIHKQSLLGLLVCGFLLGSSASADNHSAEPMDQARMDESMAMHGDIIRSAIESLGASVQSYEDAEGDPHFVLDSEIGSAQSIAIFTDDCGEAGCEDITLYAAFPANQSIGHELINEWNHISSKLRSRAAHSSNGELTLSMTVSFLSDAEQKKLAMLIGLFMVEVNMMSATIDKNT
jgi:hypothetical protein